MIPLGTPRFLCIHTEATCCRHSRIWPAGLSWRPPRFYLAGEWYIKTGIKNVWAKLVEAAGWDSDDTKQKLISTRMRWRELPAGIRDSPAEESAGGLIISKTYRDLSVSATIIVAKQLEWEVCLSRRLRRGKRLWLTSSAQVDWYIKSTTRVSSSSTRGAGLKNKLSRA